MKWPADQTERRRTDSLVPYARNARTHDALQVAQIAALIQQWGWTVPVLIDESGGVIAGHGRILAAQSLGLEEVPVMVAVGWSTEQKRAYVLADNKLTLNGGWDKDLLSLELGELSDAGFNMDLVGFGTDELDSLLQKPGRTDPDAVPKIDPVLVSRPGDIWICGRHRVVCGDSTDPATYVALMDGRLADAVWTDPPYNVAYESKAGTIANDNLEDSDFLGFLTTSFKSISGAMKPGAAIYIAHADTEGLNFRRAFAAAGLKLSGVVIWRKDALVLGRSDYQWIHEPILYGWKPGAAHKWFGGRSQTTVCDLGADSPFVQLEDGRWQLSVGDQTIIIEAGAKVEVVRESIMREARPTRSTEHPTMKPVALIERMLRNSAKPGAVVLDAFGGSGSTLIAAEGLAMSARLVELSEAYVDVIVRRWQEYSGNPAILEADGRAFDAVQKQARRAQTRKASKP